MMMTMTMVKGTLGQEYENTLSVSTASITFLFRLNKGICSSLIYQQMRHVCRDVSVVDESGIDVKALGCASQLSAGASKTDTVP